MYSAENFDSANILLESRLYNPLKNNNIEIDLSDEDCDFLNSIYLPSKYPIGSVIPDYDPDDSICKEALAIALNATKSILGKLK